MTLCAMHYPISYKAAHRTPGKHEGEKHLGLVLTTTSRHRSRWRLIPTTNDGHRNQTRRRQLNIFSFGFWGFWCHWVHHSTRLLEVPKLWIKFSWMDYTMNILDPAGCLYINRKTNQCIPVQGALLLLLLLLLLMDAVLLDVAGHLCVHMMTLTLMFWLSWRWWTRCDLDCGWLLLLHSRSVIFDHPK